MGYRWTDRLPGKQHANYANPSFQSGVINLHTAIITAVNFFFFSLYAWELLRDFNCIPYAVREVSRYILFSNIFLFNGAFAHMSDTRIYYKL